VCWLVCWLVLQELRQVLLLEQQLCPRMTLESRSL
jgi:hypothetical protein